MSRPGKTVRYFSGPGALPALISTAILMLLATAPGCIRQPYFEENFAFDPRGWGYEVKPSFDVEINDTTAVYSLFLNLRHTGGYKYSNLFLLISVAGPEQDTVTDRFEFTLAAPDGRWLGDGSGNIYSYRIPFSDSTRFRRKGLYRFRMEQNMRDPMLAGIEDAGLRIEKH